MSEPAAVYHGGPSPSTQAAIVAAAYLHPREEVRERMRPDVDSWIESLRPLHQPWAIAAVLDGHRGTAIEPFVLSEEARGAAIALLRAAFSRATEVEKVRIVSEDTLGDWGGLMVRRDLSATFLQGAYREVARQRKRRTEAYAPRRFPTRYIPPPQPAPPSRKAPYFVPPLVPERGVADRMFIPLRASTTLDGNGASIRVTAGKACGLLDGARRARVLGSEELIGRIGLSFRMVGDGFEIRTGNPESLIRFASLSARQAVLAVDSEEGSEEGVMCIRLEPLTGTVVPLRARAFVWTDLNPWLDLTLPPAPALQRWVRETAAWTGPLQEWAEMLLSWEDDHETVACC